MELSRMKIRLNIKGKEMILTKEEAKKIYNDLHDLFGYKKHNPNHIWRHTMPNKSSFGGEG